MSMVDRGTLQAAGRLIGLVSVTELRIFGGAIRQSETRRHVRALVKLHLLLLKPARVSGVHVPASRRTDIVTLSVFCVRVHWTTIGVADDRA